jgi:hypothetical protein
VSGSRLLCLLALWLLAAGAAPARNAADAQGQVLVMLPIPAPHFRPDAGYGAGYAADPGSPARRRVARQLAQRHGLALVADWPMPALGLDCYVMQPEQPGRQRPLDDLLAALMRDPHVEWAQRMALYQPLGAAGALYAAQPSAHLWRLAELHQFASGRNVTVAVVDSGADDTHPDLAGRFTARENFVDGNPYAAELHGTAVAGIIGARGGVVGIAPDARLMALRGCWQEPDRSSRCSSFTLAKALHFAIENGAGVINLSLAGPSDRLLQRLLELALARGVTVIGAADPDRPGGGFPATHPGVIAVAEQGASAASGVLLAPGRDIPAAAPGARWRFVSGSSYAAAHVAGLAALVAELRPGAPPGQIRASIVTAAQDNALASAVDACATIARLAAACACRCNAVDASN